MKNNREMFMEWLNGRETPDRLRDYSMVFPAIEAYAKSKKIIYGPIFDIDDPAIIETISQMLSNDKVFRLWHKKRIKTMTDAMELFGKYTRESATEAGVPTEPSSEEDTSEPVQIEPNQTEPVQAEPVISVPENPIQCADNAEITAKRESFANWLKLQPGYTKVTADEYAKAISGMDGLAKKYGLTEKSFYLAADNAEISAMFRAILQSDEYFKVIDNTHRLLFMGAISRYNSFLTAAKENPAETPAQADTLEPEKPAEPVCPEVAASEPEKPAEPVCPEVAASKPEKPAEPIRSEVSASVPENTVSGADADKIEAARRSFMAWMKQNSYVDLVIDKTVKSISAVDDFAKKNALLDKSIFLAKDEDELQQAVSKITLSGKFNTAFDGRQGKAFLDALERYNSFLKSGREDVAGLVPTGAPRELTQDEIDKADEMRQEFCRWMKRLKYSDAAAEKTAELISTVDDFCEKYRLLKKSIFLIKSNEELQQALGELRKSSKYEYAYNDSQHRAFSAALNRYGNFLLSDHIKQVEQRKQAIAEKKRIEAERLANAARIEAEQNVPAEAAAVGAAKAAPEKPAEPARQQAPAQSEYQAAERHDTARAIGGRDEFMQWLINDGTPSGTANSYTNSVESLGEAMRQRGIEPRSIFSIGDEQRLKLLMEEMLRCRILTPVAPETRAFKKYIVFRMNETAKSVPIVPAEEETKPEVTETAINSGTNHRELFRNWLLHDQHLADHSALSYSSAISNCEQMAFQLGLPKTQLYGADYAAAQQIAFQLMQTDEYLEANASQHNRYSAAMAKYQLYLQSADPQEPAIPAASTSSKTERHVSTFEELFEDEKYEPLYKELKKKGITTLEELKEINLWSFMNLHQLYPIQQRLAISTELTAKLRDAGKEDNEQNTSTYEIHYNGNIYKGTSPSKAFVAFLAAIATRYPLKFRAMLNVYNPEFQRIVISRYDYENTKLKLLNPEAYIDSDLTLIQVRQYIAWVIKRCDATPPQYTVEEKTNNIELPQRKAADLPDLPAEKPQKPAEKPATDVDSLLMQEAEDYLLQRDLEGATYDELQSKLRCTMVGTKEIVAQSPHIIEMNQKLYHEEALVDFEDGADALEAVLDKLLKKNDGIATAKHLYEYARSEMTMFLNDNDITDQQSVYDLARHLFEKLKYHGKQYVFKFNMYISLSKTIRLPHQIFHAILTLPCPT